MNYSAPSLERFAHCALSAYGCDDEEAKIVAEHLVAANLAGHDSHGIGMLPMYGAQIRDGNLIPNQKPEFLPRNGAITVVDAKMGFGHRITPLALDHAMETIGEQKVAILALRNAGHICRIGTYSEYCSRRGYVSIHMVNVVGHDPIVAPFGAREGGYSTNPVSMAMPLKDSPGPVLDMATSTVAFGKVRVAHNKGQTVPPGCIVDKEGVGTTDPGPMVRAKEGALTAFGEHKGSGLGVMAELMAGALAGTNTIDKARTFPNGVHNNMLSIILDPSGFDDADAIAERAQRYCNFINGLQPAKGIDSVLMPGDPENESRRRRGEHGVPIDAETLRQTADSVAKYGIAPDQLMNHLEKLPV